MTSRCLLPFAVLGLTLAAFPAQGQSVPVASLTDALGRCERPAFEPAGGSSPSFLTHEEIGGGPGLDSSCSATCGNGSTVSVNSCSGQCGAQDQNCATDTPGWVVCNGIYTHCPACPPTTPPACTAQKYCPDGTFISCQGQQWCDDGCSSWEPCDVELVIVTRTYGTCYIECDGVYTYCPGTWGPYICDGTEDW